MHPLATGCYLWFGFLWAAREIRAIGCMCKVISNEGCVLTEWAIRMQSPEKGKALGSELAGFCEHRSSGQLLCGE